MDLPLISGLPHYCPPVNSSSGDSAFRLCVLSASCTALCCHRSHSSQSCTCFLLGLLQLASSLVCTVLVCSVSTPGLLLLLSICTDCPLCLQRVPRLTQLAVSCHSYPSFGYLLGEALCTHSIYSSQSHTVMHSP